MDHKENTQDFSLEDILREFSEHPEDIQDLTEDSSIAESVEALVAETEALEAALAQPAPEVPVIPAEPTVSQDAETESPAEPDPAPAEALPEEPEMAMPRPVVLRPRTRMQELKRQIVAGPEKRFYELTEIGLGRVQMATLANLLIVVLCAGLTLMYAMDMIPENRIRLMVFSQILAMLVSGLLGCYVMMDGIADLAKFRFSLNSLLFLTFLACCADAVFCLQELRVPCCGAFSLEMTIALWNRYLHRYTELGQMDTLRKAIRLDSIAQVPDFHDGQPGFVRGEGYVDEFMNTYTEPSAPEKAQNIYAFLAFAACCAIAVATALLHSLSLAVQIFATSLLVAVPGSFFVALSRPEAILQKRLHMVGTVLCGWKGVKGLCAGGAFPLRDKDIFPNGATKLNGVKFYSDRNPDETVSYAASLMTREDAGLAGVFSQLLKSRDGQAYPVENFIDYPNGGIGGEVNGEPVLMGSLNFLQDMGVEIPEGTMVSQAVYCSIDGQLSAVFAISYAKMKSAAAGLVTLCGSRKLTPVLICGDFMVDESFLGSKFGIKTRRIAFPDPQVRRELRSQMPAPDAPVLALTTQESLTSAAYAVTGARALRTASKLGLIVHIAAGILGLLIMAALAVLGSAELLTPFRVLMYQAIWVIPGLLISTWTRTV